MIDLEVFGKILDILIWSSNLYNVMVCPRVSGIERTNTTPKEMSSGTKSRGLRCSDIKALEPPAALRSADSTDAEPRFSTGSVSRDKKNLPCLSA